MARGSSRRALDGRPFESLISTTFEGLTIAPLYQRATAEGAARCGKSRARG